MAKTSVKAKQPIYRYGRLRRVGRKCIPTASHLPVPIPIPFAVRLNGGLRSFIKTTTAAAKSDSSPSQNMLEVTDTVSHSQLVKSSVKTAKAPRKRGTTLDGARKKRTYTIWRKRKKDKKNKNKSQC